jgi:3-oxoacyl-[acyl-carrier protein] reductase
MDLGLRGKRALVMGASRGIGQGAAAALVRDGAKVAIASRSRERIDVAAEEVAATSGSPVRAFVADAGEPDSLRALAREVETALGGVDVLVANTGGPPPGDPLEFDRATWESAYRALVLGPLTLIEALAPSMRERRWGRIVNITSIGTREPIPGLVLSNSHRLAAVGLFKTLSNELARDGVLLNSVAPGRIATGRASELSGQPLEELVRAPQPDVPVGRYGRVEEVADVIAFLCSERSSYVNGINMLVDGGLARGAW